MTTRALELALRLKTAVEGVEKLQSYIQEVQNLGGDVDEAAEQAAGLATRLADVARQAAAVEVFKKVSAEAGNASQKMADLTQKSAENSAAQQRLTANLSTLRDALQFSQDKVDALSSEIQREAIIVKQAESEHSQLRAALRDAGQGQDELKAKVAASKEALDKSRASLAAKKAELRETETSQREMTRAVVQDEKALQQQEAAATKLVPALDAAKREHADLAGKVDQASKAMRYAGVDATKLAEEEKRIARESIQTRSAVAELTQAVEVQRDELTANAQESGKAASETKKLGQAQDEAADKTEKSTGMFGRAAASIAKMAAAAFTLNAAKNAVMAILETGAEFEQFGKQLTAAYGDVASGEAAFAWVEQFARKTPLELNQVLDATLKLKNFGLDPLDGTLQALVDQSAKLGGSQETLNRIITATGQAFAKGRLQGEEMLQYAEAGVPIFDLLSKSLNKTTAEVLQMAQNGELGRDVIRKLVEEMGKSSVGAAADQMNSYNGAISAAKDQTQLLMNVVAQNGPLEYFKNLISGGATEMGEMEAGAASLGQALVGLFNVIGAGFSVMGAQVNSGKMIFYSLAAVTSEVFGLIARGISKLPLGDIARGFGEAADALQIRAQELAQKSEESAQDIRDSYGKAYEQIGDATGAFVKSYELAQGQVAEASHAGGAAAVAAAEQAKKAIQDQVQALQGLQAAAKALGLDYEQLTTGIGEKSRVATDAFKKLAEDGKVSAESLFRAFDQALKEAATTQELEALKAAYTELFVPGQSQADLYKAKLDELNRKLSDATAAQDGNIERARAGAQALGLEYDRLATGVSRAARDAIAEFSNVNRANADNLNLFVAAYQAAFSKLATSEEKEAFKKALQESTQPGIQGAAEYSIALQKLQADIAQTAQAEQAASASRAANLADQQKGLQAIMQASAERYAREVEAARAAAIEDNKREAASKAAAAQKVAEMQKHSESVRGFAAGIGAWYARLHNEMGQLSKAAQQLFVQMELGGFPKRALDDADQLRQTIQGLGASIRDTNDYIRTYATPGLGELMERTKIHAATVQKMYLEQKLEVMELQRALERNDGTVAGSVARAEQLLGTFTLLGDQDLGGLRSAISDAQSRMDSLRNSAEATLAGILDDLDRLEGREASIIQRRRASQKDDIEEQLKQAKEIGDKQTIAMYQKALDTLAVVTQKEVADAKASESQKKTSQPDRQPVDTQQPTRTTEVVVNLNGKRFRGSYEASEGERFVRELESLGGVTP